MWASTVHAETSVEGGGEGKHNNQYTHHSIHAPLSARRLGHDHRFGRSLPAVRCHIHPYTHTPASRPSPLLQSTPSLHVGPGQSPVVNILITTSALQNCCHHSRAHASPSTASHSSSSVQVCGLISWSRSPICVCIIAAAASRLLLPPPHRPSTVSTLPKASPLLCRMEFQPQRCYPGFTHPHTHSPTQAPNPH